MLKTDKLSKIFYANDEVTAALDEVNFKVAQGEFVAIMGPSGCGKSTLLNIIGLLDNPTSGSYYFDGTDVSQYQEIERTYLRRGNIGFIFQSFNLIDGINVHENVELPLYYLKIPAKERKRRVAETLERMKISHRTYHFPQQLSGGQQQRAAIARAVIAEPKLILADEPTGNLDSHHGAEVMDLIVELNKKGATIIMVTHSPSDAKYAHRVIQLFDGKIISENLQENTEQMTF